MKNKIILLSFFALTLSVGVFSNLNFKETTKVEAEVGNYSTDASTYYKGITATSGEQLLGQLHNLITSTHQKYPSYDDSGVNEYQMVTDQWYDGETPVSGYIRELYSGSKIKGEWDKGATYNREHVWCQDNSGGLWGTSYGGSDMHHIRPSNPSTNSSRGNKKYGTTSGAYNPGDHVKGDVARICLYIYTHYNDCNSSIFKGYATTNGSNGKFGNLPITNNVAGTEQEAIKMLLSWNKLDPVDYMEQKRNDAVATYQGNRNPFIDNPSYADAIWGGGTTTTTTKVTGVSLNKTSASIEAGSQLTLTATITPSDATNKSVLWTSSETSVATVNNGVVTALKAGTTIITVKTNDGNFTASCQVTVTQSSSGSEQPPVSSDSITFELSEDGDKTHSDGSDLGSTYSKTVNGYTLNITDASGVYKDARDAAGNGCFKLGSGKATGSLSFTVPSEVSSVVINAAKYKSNTSTLVINGTSHSLTNNSDDGNYDAITVDTSSIKTVTVATTSSHKRAMINSIIWNLSSSSSGGGSTPTPADSITLDKTSITLDLNGSTTSKITPTVSGSKTVTWTSSNTSVADVSEGVVTAKAVGNAIITATYGSASATCNVTVIDTTPSSGGGNDDVPPASGNNFVKVTNNSDLTNGNYLIVYEESKYAFDGSLSTLDAVSNYKEVTISDNKIEATDELKASSFYIDMSGKTIKSASGNYIGQSSDSNGLTVNTSGLEHTSISVNNSEATIKSSGGAYLRFNHASNQLRFRYYKSGSYTNQKSIALYKLEEVTKTNAQLAQEFVDNFMHMDDISTSNTLDTGECRGVSGYYANAKSAFFALTKEVRLLVATNHQEAFARLQAWARANGEEIVINSGDYVVSKASNFLLVHDTNKISHLLAILSAVLTALTIVILSSYVYKKRKQ